MPRLGNSHKSLCHSPLENYNGNIVQIHLLLFNFLEMESNNTDLSSPDFFAQHDVRVIRIGAYGMHIYSWYCTHFFA